MKRHSSIQFSRTKNTGIFSLVLCAFFLPLLAGAAEQEIVIQRALGDIDIDGLLNEPDWKGMPLISNLTQVEPRSGEAPSEATKVWIAYSKDALYIAVQCDDSNPSQIVATEMRRDAMLMDNDNIEIILDTYHDHRNAYFFSTNAVGALVDGRVTENQMAAME